MPSRDSAIFLISFKCLFENINVVVPYPKTFFWIAPSVAAAAAAAAVNHKGTKTSLANGLSTFPIKGKPVFSYCPRSLPRNPLNCIILDNWVFKNFILADYLFAKASQILEACVLVNNNLWGKLVPSLELPITFDESFKAPSVPFFNPDFNLLSCQLDNFTFKMLYWVTLY